MKILIPTAITDTMLGTATTVAEPAAGETVWASGASYSAGDLRIRVNTHRVYLCAAPHSGRTAPPEIDSAYWQDIGPTRRWAPFDNYVSTSATASGSLTYVLTPGFVNALALYGLTGSSVAVSIKDEPGGSLIYSATHQLYEGASGWYEYLFVTPKAITKMVLDNLPVRPNAEITVTVSAPVGGSVGLGMLVCGDFRSLVGDASSFGGTQYGASAEPVTYSYINTDEYGTTKIVRRHAATSMRATVTLPRIYADKALAQIQEVLDVPAAWVATQAGGYEGLNVFGLGSARVSYDSFSTANIDLTVKGLI